MRWLSFLSLAIWTFLLLGRRFFWAVRVPPSAPGPTPPAKVVAVIPARNEADTVAQTVHSLLGQCDTIIVVDDSSTDATSRLARDAGAEVVAGAPLPIGWTGKLWALEQGIQRALDSRPDYLLLTDADIVHAPGNVADLVRRAEAGQWSLVSLMVLLRCESLAEKSLIPAFLFFFLKLYPPAEHRGAAGGCILLRPEALARMGGMAAIRGELIDDCALAGRVRQSGGTVWMGVTKTTRSTRAYHTFADVGRIIARTAYTQLRYSPLLLAAAVLGLAVTYLLPTILALAGYPAALAAWILMCVAYTPSLRLYGRSLLWAPALPLIALFYLGATVWSALQYWTGRGGLWKGRVNVRAAPPARE